MGFTCLRERDRDDDDKDDSVVGDEKAVLGCCVESALTVGSLQGLAVLGSTVDLRLRTAEFDGDGESALIEETEDGMDSLIGDDGSLADMSVIGE